MRTIPITLPHTQAVEAELRRWFDRKSSDALAHGQAFHELWEVTGRRISGGKLVRPRIMLAAIDALRGDPGTRSISRGDAIRVAAAIELLHYSFLLHDDVIDGDLTRRGEPNLIAELAERASALGSPDALHWARSCAILMGDLLLAEVHQAIARAPEAAREQLFALLAHTIAETVAGEQLDIGFADRTVVPTTDLVIDMTAWKTATYSFELPLRAAIALTGAGGELAAEGQRSPIASASRHLGLAFQLQDDLLSTFGNPESHGKDAFSDLREGKITSLISIAQSTPEWEQISPHFGEASLTAAEAARIQSLLEASGARARVEARIAAELDALHSLLLGTALPAALAETIRGFARDLDGRVA